MVARTTKLVAPERVDARPASNPLVRRLFMLAVVVVAGSALADGAFLRPAWETLGAALAGGGIGVLVALGLACLACSTASGDRVLRLTASLAAALPAVAWLPIALLWVGPRRTTVVCIVAIAVVLPLATGLKRGFAAADATLLAVGRNIGLSEIRLVTDVRAPAALPHALVGLTAAWAAGWQALVAAELVLGFAGGEGGLGAYAVAASREQLVLQGAAALLTVAGFGLLVQTALRRLERRTVVCWGMEAEM